MEHSKINSELVGQKTILLSALACGEVAEIVAVCCNDSELAHRLTGLGVLPGSRLTLLRAAHRLAPSVIVAFGEGRLVLDATVAKTIMVRRT